MMSVLFLWGGKLESVITLLQGLRARVRSYIFLITLQWQKHDVREIIHGEWKIAC